MKRAAIILLLVLPMTAAARAGGAPTLPCGPGQATRLVAPAGGKAYHSAYFSMKPNETVYTSDWIDQWVTMTGKQPAVIVFSNHWGRNGKLTGPVFPAETVQLIWDKGAVPDVRMMAWTQDWSSKGPDPVVSMKRIIRGDFDGRLRDWFAAARDLPIPFMVEFGVEVNGRWFPWNGLWNGAGKRGWGDPNYPDGPERFIKAYRHIRDLADGVGADDLTWVFHPDVGSYPNKPWNQPEKYYPGDAYVDWVMFSDYGEQGPNENYWETFAERLGDPADPGSIYSRLRAIAPTKPFGVIEFGVTDDGDGSKAQWYTDAYDSFTPPGNDYDVDIASVWSEKWRNGDGSVSDLRVNSSPQALDAYKAAIADAHFVTTPEFACT